MAKVWLVTGSGSGLGRDVVEAALAAGNRVVATARRPEQLQDLVRHYGDKVRAIRQDVTNSEEAEAAVTTAKEAFGRLDVVVNNAGYTQFGPFEQISAEDFKAIVDTCFYGVVYTTRAALPVMRKQTSFPFSKISPTRGSVWFSVNGLALEVRYAVHICSPERRSARTIAFSALLHSTE